MMFSRKLLRAITETVRKQTSGTTSTYYVAYSRAFTSSAVLSKKYAKSTRKFRNEEIKTPIVQCLNEANELDSPEPLSDIINRTKLNTHFVELVQEDPPIVQVVSKAERQEELKASKPNNRKGKTERKEIQMTWSLSESDLMHKITKAREHLEHGRLVDIAFAPKAKHTWPTPQIMEEKIKKVVDALQDIAIERQERTLLKKVGILYLRPDKSKLGKK